MDFLGSIIFFFPGKQGRMSQIQICSLKVYWISEPFLMEKLLLSNVEYVKIINNCTVYNMFSENFTHVKILLFFKTSLSFSIALLFLSATGDRS